LGTASLAVLHLAESVGVGFGICGLSWPKFRIPNSKFRIQKSGSIWVICGPIG